MPNRCSHVIKLAVPTNGRDTAGELRSTPDSFLGVSVRVHVETVGPRTLAAVRREAHRRDVRRIWRPAIDTVWEFLRTHPGLWADGHNVFVYHHAADPSAAMRCDFGVEITRGFEGDGEVKQTETPSGEAVIAVYRGPYDGLAEAYDAIETWMTAHARESAGHTWEIYGDPAPDEQDTETKVLHLLRPAETSPRSLGC